MFWDRGPAHITLTLPFNLFRVQAKNNVVFLGFKEFFSFLYSLCAAPQTIVMGPLLQITETVKA